MILYQDNRRSEAAALESGGEFQLCIASRAERDAALKALGRQSWLRIGAEQIEFGCFESRQGFDYIALMLLQPAEGCANAVEIFFTPGQLLFFGDGRSLEQLDQALKNDPDGPASPGELGDVLPLFFALLTKGDAAALAKLEDEISKLEDEIVDNKPKNYTRRISALRKKLLRLKRFYESLALLLGQLCENQNELLSERQLRLLGFEADRADRLHREVLNLRDYVTQVREAYQNQTDISLNQTMKLFTILTAIFAPLTLLVGWYGMNFQMPEYGWRAAYPALIVLSIVITVLLIVYFKRKKWF